MFSHLIAASDAKVDATFANKGGDVGSGEEDEGYRMVFDESDVKAGFAAKLYIGAGKEVEGGLL